MHGQIECHVRKLVDQISQSLGMRQERLPVFVTSQSPLSKFDPSHPEFYDVQFNESSQVPRSYYGKVTVRFD